MIRNTLILTTKVLLTVLGMIRWIFLWPGMAFLMACYTMEAAIAILQEYEMDLEDHTKIRHLIIKDAFRRNKERT